MHNCCPSSLKSRLVFQLTTLYPPTQAPGLQFSAWVHHVTATTSQSMQSFRPCGQFGTLPVQLPIPVCPPAHAPRLLCHLCIISQPTCLYCVPRCYPSRDQCHIGILHSHHVCFSLLADPRTGYESEMHTSLHVDSQRMFLYLSMFNTRIVLSYTINLSDWSV